MRGECAPHRACAQRDRTACMQRHVGPSEATSLLSALTLATAACGCTLPVFVAVDEPRGALFRGRSVSGAFVARCEVRKLIDLSPALRHLSGLTALFNERAPPALDPRAKLMVAASFIFRQSSEDWEDVNSDR